MTEPTRENMLAIAKFLRVSFEWLSTGAGRAPDDDAGTRAKLPVSSSASPTYIQELDVRAGMGGGGFMEDRVRQDGTYVDAVKEDAWVFPSSFTQGVLRVPASQLLILEVQGDSMYPTLSPGERVVVHTGHRVPSPDGIYALRDRFDMIVVKRLQALRNAPKVKVISDNTAHPVEEVGLDEITILGKVTCGLRLL